MTKKKTKKKKSNRVIGTPFKKGQSGNPKGRPKEAPEVKAAKRALKEELAKVSDLLTMSPEEAAEVLADPSTSVLAGIVGRAIKKSDWKILEHIINRQVGKIKDNVEVKSEITNHNINYDEIPLDKLKKIKKLLDE